MDCFLERIDGRSSEDLTSEMLGYFLTSREYSPYQRLFYSLIFPDQELKDSEERQYEIITQMSFDEFGRPDIVIESEQQVIFIENKFYASFSLDNQMYRYFHYLKGNYEDKEKYLILLTIKDRIALYLRDICKQFEAVLTTGSNKDLFNYCRDNGVTLQAIAWEDIFRLYGTRDFLISSLYSYIKTKYITSTILNEREIEMINSKDVPMLMEKLWAGIDKIRDILVGDNFNVLRTSQSKIFYGFPVERFWGKVYVDYYHLSWLNYGAPYILQIRSDWINEKYRTTEMDSHMKSAGFIVDSEMGYIFLVNITEADIAGTAAEIIKDTINKLDKIFELVED